jgi:PAS domain S-box-containing protein
VAHEAGIDGHGAEARLRLAHEIDQAILAAESVGDLAARTITVVRELIGADRVAFVRYDLAGGTATRLAASWSEGGPDEGPGVAPLASILGAHLQQQPATLVYPRLDEAIGIAPGASVMLDQGIRAGAFVPLVAAGRLLGALVLGGRDASFLTEEHLAFVRDVADQLAVATVNAEAREQLQLSVARLGVVHEIDSALLDASTAIEVAGRVADRIRVLVGADRLGIVSYNFDRAEATVLAVVPDDQEGGTAAGMTVLIDVAAPPALRNRTTAAVYPDLRAVTDIGPGVQALLGAGVVACAYVPLIAHDRVIGALILGGNAPDFLTGEHLRVARETGAQLSIAIEHARAGEALERSVARLQMVHDIDRAILEADSVADLATRTVAGVRALIGADRVAFVRYDLVQGTATRLAIAWPAGQPQEPAGVSTPIERVLGSSVLERPETRVFRDAAAALDLFPGASYLIDQGLTAGAFLPLVADGRLIGALVLGGRDPLFLTDEHLAIAREVADRLAIAAVHAEARELLELSVARLELVHDIDRAILSTGSTRDIAAAASERFRRLVRAERVGISSYDHETGMGRVLATAVEGVSPGIPDDIVFPLAGQVPLEDWRRGDVIPYPDLRAVSATIPAAARALAEGYTLGATVPLVAGDRLIGAVTIAGNDPAMLRPETLTIARTVGDQLAIALQNARDREDLVASETRLRAMLEASPNGILTVDHEARIRYANPAAHRLFRAAAGDLAGRALSELAPYVDGPMLATRVGHWFAAGPAGQAAHPIDAEARRLDGTTFPVHVLLAPIDTSGGALAIATVIDLTERTGLESRLRQAERLEVIGQFASIIAHDIRNYLTTVSWSAELLAGQLEPGHPGRADLDLIDRAATDGIAMTRSVLEFARPSGNARGVTEVASHLARTRTMLERVLGEWVRLDLEAAADLPAAGIGAAALTQVLVNLAANARDAMPTGGRFRIEAVEHVSPGTGSAPILPAGRYIRLLVSDSGTGMDEATRRRAFDPFFTTKAAASTAAGTGLGLSSVYLIVTRIGGAIRIESEQATGTTFTVDIPVA